MCHLYKKEVNKCRICRIVRYTARTMDVPERQGREMKAGAFKLNLAVIEYEKDLTLEREHMKNFRKTEAEKGV